MRRSTTLDPDGRRVLVSNDFGDYAILSAADHADLLTGQIYNVHPKHADLEARALLDESPRDRWSDLERAAHATRKAFALEGPSLHIFVVTLRCDHSCHYCQVSRAAVGASGFDMSEADADAAVDLVFQSPSNDLTIEFQGGEPALRFDLVRRIVERAEARNLQAEHRLTFAMVSTLHHLTEDDLIFCRDHAIRLSTSIDGPAEWHDAHRPNPTRDSWERTIAALARARAILGDDGVSALPTLTRRSMAIVTGLNKIAPASYGVVIGVNFANQLVDEDDGKMVMMVSRMQRMENPSPQNLNGFLDGYRATGAYFLVPAVMRPGAAEPDVFEDLAILKRSLDLKAAWTITDNDMDMSILSDDDHPFVPDGVEDAPVIGALARIRELRQTRGQ